MSQAKIAYFDSKQAWGQKLADHHPSNEKRKDKAIFFHFCCTNHNTRVSLCFSFHISNIP